MPFGPSDSGFTLTELLIVIVILGVLTGIVVFAVGAFANRGEVSACKAAMKTVEIAVETYRAKSGTVRRAGGHRRAGAAATCGAAPAPRATPSRTRLDRGRRVRHHGVSDRRPAPTAP